MTAVVPYTEKKQGGGMARWLGVWVSALLMLISAGCSSGDGGTAQPVRRLTTEQLESGGPMLLYTDGVVPILKEHCYRCHGGMNHKGGLNLETQDGMRKGGKNGPDVVPGDPDRSPLVLSMRQLGAADHFNLKPMPPAPRARVAAVDIELMARWVKEGAVMPPDVKKP